MRWFANIVALALAALPALAAATPGAVLEYRLKVRPRDGTFWTESGFRVVTSPALRTRNKVHKPRMGRWRIEPMVWQGAVPSSALLARVAGFLYFSGPTPQVVPRASGITFGHRWCRLWQAEAPAGTPAFAYLAEVAPHLLALSYLSATLPEGEIGSLEIHLLKVALGPHTVPAEEGTALVNTLQRWRPAPINPRAPKLGEMASEQIP